MPTLFAEEVAGSNDVAVARFVDAVAEKVAGPFACRHADRHRAVEPIANGDTPRRFVDVFDGAVRARSQRPRARGRIRRVVAPAAGDLALRLLGELIGQQRSVARQIMVRVGVEKATDELCRPEGGGLRRQRGHRLWHRLELEGARVRRAAISELGGAQFVADRGQCAQEDVDIGIGVRRRHAQPQPTPLEGQRRKDGRRQQNAVFPRDLAAPYHTAHRSQHDGQRRKVDVVLDDQTNRTRVIGDTARDVS